MCDGDGGRRGHPGHPRVYSTGCRIFLRNAISNVEHRKTVAGPQSPPDSIPLLTGMDGVDHRGHRGTGTLALLDFENGFMIGLVTVPDRLVPKIDLIVTLTAGQQNGALLPPLQSDPLQFSRILDHLYDTPIQFQVHIASGASMDGKNHIRVMKIETG